MAEISDLLLEHTTNSNITCPGDAKRHFHDIIDNHSIDLLHSAEIQGVSKVTNGFDLLIEKFN